MPFTRRYNAEIQHLGPLFAAAERADKEFHDGLKEGQAKRGLSRYKQTDRYDETLKRFRDATRVIDEVVSTAFAQAKLGDFAQVPTLFAYVAFPGRYYTSGYQRANIWRFLKKLPLDEEQVGILRGIVVRQIETAGPEFREVFRAAARIDSPDLRENVKILARGAEKDFVRRRAEQLLAFLESGPTCR